MQITPRRRAVIIGYRKLNLTFTAIAAAVNVPRSTASTIYYNAVNSARAESDALLAGINKGLEQLQLEGAREEAARERAIREGVREKATKENAAREGGVGEGAGKESTKGGTVREGTAGENAPEEGTGEEAAGEGAAGEEAARKEAFMKGAAAEGAAKEGAAKEGADKKGATREGAARNVKLAVAGEELSLLDLLAAGNLDSRPRSGRPQALSEAEKDHLVATVKRDFRTRRMVLVDLRREAGLSHVCNTTVWNALRERGIKAYREQFKFILTTHNKKIRLVRGLSLCNWVNTNIRSRYIVRSGDYGEPTRSGRAMDSPMRCQLRWEIYMGSAWSGG